METSEIRALLWGSSLTIAICALLATYFLVRILSEESGGRVRLLALVVLAATLAISGPGVAWLLESFSETSFRVLPGPLPKWTPAALSLAFGAWFFLRRRRTG